MNKQQAGNAIKFLHRCTLNPTEIPALNEVAQALDAIVKGTVVMKAKEEQKKEQKKELKKEEKK